MVGEDLREEAVFGVEGEGGRPPGGRPLTISIIVLTTVMPTRFFKKHSGKMPLGRICSGD